MLALDSHSPLRVPRCVSVMSTQEIAKAFHNLDTNTLKSSLKVVEANSDGNKEAVEKKYQEAVLDVGLKGFISKLKAGYVPDACKALGIESGDKSENELRKNMEDAVSKTGIVGLCDKADDSLLKKFSETLGLETAEREDMKKQIADEVMLTGMESFLNKLSLALLKAHAAEMKLTATGSKKDLVEK